MRLSGLFAIALVAVAGCKSEPPAGGQPRPTTPIRFAAVRDAMVTPAVPTTTAALADVMSDLTALPALDFLALAGGSTRDASDAELSADAKELASVVGILEARKFFVTGGSDARNAALVRRAYADAGVSGGKEQTLRSGLVLLVLASPDAPSPASPAADAADLVAEANALAIESVLAGSAPDATIIVLAYGPPPRGPMAARLAADKRVKALVVGLRGDVPNPEPWRGVAIIDAPSLAKSHGYLLVTIEGARVIASVRAVGRAIPVVEQIYPLRR
jgi:hypothetical protein